MGGRAGLARRGPDRLTGLRRPWPITVNSNLGIFAVSGHGGDLVVGGDFTRVNRIVRNHLARFREILDTVPPSAPASRPPPWSTPGTSH